MTIENLVSSNTSPTANTATSSSEEPAVSVLDTPNGQMHPSHTDRPNDSFPTIVSPPPMNNSLDQNHQPRYNHDQHLFVGNIPWLATVQDLRDYFLVESGHIVHIDFPYDSVKKRAKGYANIFFSNQDSVNEAIAKYNNVEFRGRRLQVKQPQGPWPHYTPHPMPMYYAATPPPPSSVAGGPLPPHVESNHMLLTPPATYANPSEPPPPQTPAHSSGASAATSYPMYTYVPYLSHDNLYSMYASIPYASYPNLPAQHPLVPLKPPHPAFIMPDMRAIRNSEKPPDTSMKSNVLWFGNIPLGARWQNVKDIIKATGVTPIRVDLNISKSHRSSHHNATVIFPSAEDAQIAAGKLNGLLWQGSPLLVRSDRHEFRESNTLFLRNVPFDCTKEQLQLFFNDFGFTPLQSSLAEFSRGRKGFATVELASPEDAQHAVEILNGKFLSDRQVKVSLFERRTYGFRIFIGNLPWKATWQDIKDLFRRYGFYPGRVEIMTHPQTHQSKGFGIVIVSSREEAQRAIMVLNGASIFGRQIVVRFDKS